MNLSYTWAKVMLYDISSKLREAHGLGSTETVTFRQFSAEAQTYRDAVEFSNGVRVRLQELEDGQRAEVLTLSSEDADVPGALMTDAFGSARLQAQTPFERQAQGEKYVFRMAAFLLKTPVLAVVGKCLGS